MDNLAVLVSIAHTALAAPIRACVSSSVNSVSSAGTALRYQQFRDAPRLDGRIWILPPDRGRSPSAARGPARWSGTSRRIRPGDLLRTGTVRGPPAAVSRCAPPGSTRHLLVDGSDSVCAPSSGL